ncbi:MAG: chitinase [Bacteroidota bacterium]
MDYPIIRLRDGFRGQKEHLRPDIRRFQRLLISAGERAIVADGWYGTQSKQATERIQGRDGFVSDGVVRPSLWVWMEYLGGGPRPSPGRGMSLGQLVSIVGQRRATEAQRHLEGLNGAMSTYDIDTPLRRAHFLAQVAHESGGLRWTEELASGDAYEGRDDLGNTQPGDGRRFKGRGLIQLTGRFNYRQYTTHHRQNGGRENFESRPTQVAEPPFASDVAGWFWDTRNINALADTDDIEAVTRRVNGGLRGIDERRRYLSLAKTALMPQT